MERLNKVFKLSDNKSKVVLSNIFYSFFIKGINIVVSFLTVPLVLTFLSTTQYGIWLTLTAILSWFSLFDLGFGNGLRNHLTVAISNNNFKEGKIYVSTTYASLSFIMGCLLIMFLVIRPYVNWVRIFNAPISMADDINAAVLFTISFLFVQFIVRLINTVLLAFQRAAIADFTNSIVQICIFIGLYLLKIFHQNSLSDVAIVYSITPVVVFFIISLILFTRTYSFVRPSITFIRVKYINRLLRLGLNFFIIQVAALILYASDNFIIAQLFKPADVTIYNIAFKYFGVVNIFFSIILVPFWSMTTKASEEDDVKWIKKAINNLVLILILLSFAGVVQLIFAKKIINVWTHNVVAVPFNLSLVMVIYFIFTNWGNVFGNFLNGTGKIRLQLYVSVFCMIINIPLAIILASHFKLGIVGIPLSTIITMLIANVLSTIQYSKIVNKSAVGIWNK